MGEGGPRLRVPRGVVRSATGEGMEPRAELGPGVSVETCGGSPRGGTPRPASVAPPRVPRAPTPRRSAPAPRREGQGRGHGGLRGGGGRPDRQRRRRRRRGHEPHTPQHRCPGRSPRGRGGPCGGRGRAPDAPHPLPTRVLAVQQGAGGCARLLGGTGCRWGRIETRGHSHLYQHLYTPSQSDPHLNARMHPLSCAPYTSFPHTHVFLCTRVATSPASTCELGHPRGKVRRVMDLGAGRTPRVLGTKVSVGTTSSGNGPLGPPVIPPRRVGLRRGTGPGVWAPLGVLDSATRGLPKP